MGDLDKKIIELMDLFDGEVTTADKIDTPEPREDVQNIEAINRFMRDNPPSKADGGRIDFKRGSQPPPDTSPVKTDEYKYPRSNRFGTVYSRHLVKISTKQPNTPLSLIHI